MSVTVEISVLEVPRKCEMRGCDHRVNHVIVHRAADDNGEVEMLAKFSRRKHLAHFQEAAEKMGEKRFGAPAQVEQH